MKVCSCCGRIFVNERDFLKGTSRWRVCTHGHLYFNCSCHSTIVIIKGKHDWYSPDKVMSTHASSVFNSLPKDIVLPALPEVAMRVQLILQNENSSLEELIKATKADPLLAIKIMRFANSGRAAGSSPIQSIRDALQFIGRKRLSELTLPAAMISFDFRTKKYPKSAFWSEAFTTGIIAEQLAQIYLKKEEMDLAYFSGIFANIGKVVGAILLPDEVDKVYESTILLAAPMNWREAEQATKSIDHHVLGEIAATLWGLPPKLLDTIYHHHDTVQTELQNKTDLNSQLTVSDVATFANQISHLVRFESHRLDSKVLESCLKAFKVDEKLLQSYVQRFSRYAESTQDLTAS